MMLAPLLASWTEPAGKEHALKFAEYRNGKWSEPRVIAQRSDFFVNRADFPSITKGSDGTLYAHWLQKSGKGVDLVWIDNGTIHHASLDANGRPKNEVELDAKSCECCATGMTMTAKGPIVVFRDRLEGEIRDISITRLVNGKWTAPVNGPQADAIGERLAVASFTGAAPKARVQLVWSNDAGATFSKPVMIDDGKPLGRVDVAMLDANTALVTWLEQTANGAEIRISGEGARSRKSLRVSESLQRFARDSATMRP